MAPAGTSVPGAFAVDGRVVVVTGASGGLGSRLAQDLAAAGARVVAVGRQWKHLEQVVDRIRDSGGAAIGVTADVTAPSDREAVVRSALRAFGGIDALVNNAGAVHRALPESVAEHDYDVIHSVNAKAALFLAQEARPHLAASGRGSIVNITSIALWTSGAESILYRSSKAALHAATMVIARDWGRYGIRANTVAPGTFDAGMGARLTAEHHRAATADIPLGRTGRAGELSPVVQFLISDASSFVSGSTLRVDGGRVAT